MFPTDVLADLTRDKMFAELSEDVVSETIGQTIDITDVALISNPTDTIKIAEQIMTNEIKRLRGEGYHLNLNSLRVFITPPGEDHADPLGQKLTVGWTMNVEKEREPIA